MGIDRTQTNKVHTVHANKTYKNHDSTIFIPKQILGAFCNHKKWNTIYVYPNIAKRFKLVSRKWYVRVTVIRIYYIGIM
jgi:hypothetical protein